jgi:serine phosphatase RsbU (regulator of sigma subunit)
MTFLANAIILIIVNSTRISWIAFLSKKQKKTLLLYSVLLIILFAFNVGNAIQGKINSAMVQHFSLSLEQFKIVMNIYGIIYFGFMFFTILFHLPTADAFDRKATEVSSLQYFSKLINQVLDFKELSDTITDLAIKVCNADAAFILFKENESYTPTSLKNIGFVQTDRLTSFIWKHKKNDLVHISWITIPHSENDFAGEKYFHVSCAPLRSHNKIAGYLIAVKKLDVPFDDEDKNAIQTFTDYASIAIENSRLLEESIEKERMERELFVAREMQRRLIPQNNPKREELEIASMFIPAFEVGGDYYDFFELKGAKLGFVVADVAGKGITAAFIMAEIRGIFESLTKLIESPKQILVSANNILKRTLDRKSFVSAYYGVFDFRSSKLHISRAGHTSLLITRDNEVQEIIPSGCGLGLTYSKIFEESLDEIEIDLKENDIITFYTDGITEAKNDKLEDFGIERLKSIILSNNLQSANEISNKIITDVTTYSQNSHQWDDITLLLFKWKNKNGVA